MADLLTMLGQLQTRFAPFLERYQNFMQEDPEISPEVCYLQKKNSLSKNKYIFFSESKTDSNNAEPGF